MRKRLSGTTEEPFPAGCRRVNHGGAVARSGGEHQIGAMSSPAKPRALADRWSTAKPAERANAQLSIIQLCDALGVEASRPAGSSYDFELPSS